MRSMLMMLGTLAFVGIALGQQRQGLPTARETGLQKSIYGIWWSPEMIQSAAFQIKDSTIYYPDSFTEFNYQLRGDTLVVFRDDGPSVSIIVQATTDTLILFGFGQRQIYTRSETKSP